MWAGATSAVPETHDCFETQGTLEDFVREQESHLTSVQEKDGRWVVVREGYDFDVTERVFFGQSYLETGLDERTQLLGYGNRL